MSNSKTVKEFRRIMENADPAKIVSTLMYNPDTDEHKLDNWESGIEDGFYKTFGKISTMLPDDFRYMDELRTAIYSMADVHDETYFHLGMLYGFSLYRNFSDECSKYDIPGHSGICKLSESISQKNEWLKSLGTILNQTKELTDKMEQCINKLTSL